MTRGEDIEEEREGSGDICKGYKNKDCKRNRMYFRKMKNGRLHVHLKSKNNVRIYVENDTQTCK